MSSQLLQQAASLHRSGKLADAERLYKQVLKADRKSFPAQYMLAVLLYQQQRPSAALRAVDLALKLNPDSTEALSLHGILQLNAGQHKKALFSLSKVVTLNPGDAEAWHNRGVILTELHRFEDAVQSIDKALAIQPTAEAWTNRGAALLKSNKLDEALGSFDKALALKPDFFGALYSRGNALMDLRRYEEAVAVFDKMLANAPDVFEIWNNRGIALHGMKRFEESVESYDKAVGVKPDFAPAWTNRGKVLQDLNRYEDAVDSYDKALAISSGSLDGWYGRAVSLRSLQRLEDALMSVDKVLSLQRDFLPTLLLRGWILCEFNRISDGLAVLNGAAVLVSKSRSNDEAPAHKQRHDAEQREYLSAQNVQIDDNDIYLTGGEKLSGPAVNPANAESATAQWEKSSPRVAVIDNLLTEDALEKLRRFCWGSTIWKTSYDDGYLGAMAEHGFASPLLAQIAEELRDTFPAIVGDHGLRMLWAFKYDSALRGIRIHADQAAVNVNFWITPNEANQNAEGGGLVIWDVAAPKDWDPEKYNGDEAAMRGFLESAGAKPITVPHRANRAVIFDSDLFHETDDIDFKEGYLNRRINITMLYGRRTVSGL